MSNITPDAVRDRLREAVFWAGGLRRFAKLKNIDAGALSRALADNGPISPAVGAAVGCVPADLWRVLQNSSTREAA